MRVALSLILLAACHGSSGNTPGDDDDDGSAAPDAPAASTDAPILPTPTGTCPAIAPGDVTFAPAGIPPRKVKLAFDPAKAGPAKAGPAGTGELIFYWYATGSGTFESGYSLGATLTAITDAGGIVATPYADPSAGQFEWFMVNGSAKLDDFLVADEVVGCLAQAHLIDAKRIHSMGMSAGALQTTALSFVRSAYIASVATYSGGIPPGFSPTTQDPANKFAALIFDGGATDDVFSVDFKAASETYETMLKAAGHFAALCDHGMGHAIPLDAAPSVAAFFTANPYGAWPSPYAGGLPSTFPSYCSL